ncbi:MAG TPA: IPT/TIG domain-containing protein [Candidatus Hydrogenedentes bacterium]|nr:IPT/TIG domain-containing protein [Candidatus Hydrogenedentota bacterium]HOL76333.1 IPT/TIG domain-containing protein [Candidatus Hydrogenedentota bacterium]HPO86161.1 IPT/TIG domain-containing protein [Candidatus Hydrogenedentota bacterium]
MSRISLVVAQLLKTKTRTGRAIALGMVALTVCAVSVSQEATPTSSIVITTDGANPVPSSYILMVGSSQDFAVLRVFADGTRQAASPGEIQWTFSAPNLVEVSVDAVSGFAVVTAVREGEGVLRATDDSGAVTEVRLCMRTRGGSGQAATSGALLGLRVPSDNARIFYQQASSGVPLTVLAANEGPVAFDRLQFTLDGFQLGVAQEAPYAVTHRDVTVLPTWQHHRVSVKGFLASSDGQPLERTLSFFTVPIDADKNGDGLPDDLLSLGMAPGDLWVARTGKSRPNTLNGNEAAVASGSVVIAALPVGINPGASVVIQDPDNPKRTTVVTVAPGLLQSNEIGFLIVVVSDELDGIVESAPTLPSHELTPQGAFVFASVIASRDGGKTFFNLDKDRLADGAVRIDMYGVAVVPDENARFLMYPAAVGNAEGTAEAGLRLSVSHDGTWSDSSRGSQIRTGVISTWMTAPGIYAPFVTPSQIQILGVWNADTGTPSGYCIGGDTVMLRLANAPRDVIPSVAFDGISAPHVEQVSGTPDLFMVTSPRAPRSEAPVTARKVDVQVSLLEDPDNRDTLADGFTFVGPEIDTIRPNTGPQNGGTTVWLWGHGFDKQGMAARIGTSVLVQISDVTPTLFRGVTTPGEAAIADVVVRTSNGYLGILRNGYTYTQDEASIDNGVTLNAPSSNPATSSETSPRVVRIEPATAWSYGGCVVRLSGSGFVPDATRGTRVFIGGQEASYAPPAAGTTPSTTDLYVIAPGLPSDVEPDFDRVKVAVAVVNPDGTQTAYPACFTYVRNEKRLQTTPAQDDTPACTDMVHSWTFSFDSRTGSGTCAFPITDGLVPDTLYVDIPPLPDAWKGTVFALIRATREYRLLGLENIAAGESIEGCWAVDVHLYRGEYPFDELKPQFDLHTDSLVIDFPTTDKMGQPLLFAGDIQSGGTAVYRLDTSLSSWDYFNADWGYVVDGDTAGVYQWNVGAGDTAPAIARSGNPELPVERVRFKADRTGSFMLRKCAFIPDELLKATSYAIAEDSPKSGPYGGGTEIRIVGRGLAWPNRIRFGEVTAYLPGTSLEGRLLYADDTEIRVLSPAVTPRDGSLTVDIGIDLPQGLDKAEREVVLQKQYTLQNLGPLATILAALVAVPVALIGLFAGGKSGGGGGGPCFIATAAYGTPLAEQIDVLRAVRDHFLLTNAFGTAIVDVYYRVSPALADVIAAHPLLAGVVRLLLWPVVWVSRAALAMPGVIWPSFALLTTLALYPFRRKRSRRNTLRVHQEK